MNTIEHTVPHLSIPFLENRLEGICNAYTAPPSKGAYPPGLGSLYAPAHLADRLQIQVTLRRKVYVWGYFVAELNVCAHTTRLSCSV